MLIEMVDSKNPKKVIRVSPGDVDRFKEQGFGVKGEEKPSRLGRVESNSQDKQENLGKLIQRQNVWCMHQEQAESK